MQRSQKRIGEFLVDKGLISDEELRSALDEQKTSKKFIGEIFLHRGMVTERELSEALAEQFNMPFVNLGPSDIDWDLALRFPSSLILEHNCMPVHEEEDYITVAITNPLEVSAVGDIEKLAEFRKIKAVLVTASNMKEMVEVYRKRHLKDIEDLFKE